MDEENIITHRTCIDVAIDPSTGEAHISAARRVAVGKGPEGASIGNLCHSDVGGALGSQDEEGSDKIESCRISRHVRFIMPAMHRWKAKTVRFPTVPGAYLSAPRVSRDTAAQK